MTPLYPAVFSRKEAGKNEWANLAANHEFFAYLKGVASDFPSLLLARSAGLSLSESMAAVAEGLLSLGINVFMPPDPTPISALSHAVSSRNMPMGLYLDTDATGDNLVLTALANHGGPPDQRDVPIDGSKKIEKRTGVAGVTEIDKYYVNHLAGFADPFIENGVGLRSIAIPFPEIEQRLRETAALKILFEVDDHGYRGVIGNDGQKLELFDKNEVAVPANVIAETIAAYLVTERRNSGTVVGPVENIALQEEAVEFLHVEGDVFDMNFQAGFSNLLIGWWHNGAIAHQGSSSFGDGILSALYFLEAKRSAA